MRFPDVLRGLEARDEQRIVPGLDRIRALAELLGDPHLAYPTVHVAGTNGKTTTARAIGRILCAHGVAAGVHTSPHLHSVTERFAYCDEPISETELTETYAHLKLYLDEVDGREDRVTYFEALTALAFLWFADKPVDVGVFEVGMGGRWDATNIIRSETAVICPVALDHAELGATVAEVAGEKAGILKEGTAAVVRGQEPGAMKVLEARADEVGATLHREGEEFELVSRELMVGGQRIGVRGLHGEYGGLAPPLHGEHQARNVAAAVVAAELVLQRALDEDTLRGAVAGISSPGRLEVVSRHPLVVVDGAHNPAGAAALAAAVGEAFVWKRLFLVLGVLEGKDAAGIAEALASRTTSAFVCPSSSPRAMDPERLAEVCERAGIPAIAHPSVASALEAAESAAGQDDLILVTGSLTTVADARARPRPR